MSHKADAENEQTQNNAGKLGERKSHTDASKHFVSSRKF